MIVKEIKSEAYQIRLEHHPEYLQAYVEGKEDSVEISRKYWSELISECERHHYKKLLIEENLQENVTSAEMFEFAKDLPNLVTGSIIIAFVDRQLEHQDLNRFGELVANNRGLRSKVFNTVSDAERWLLAN